MSAANAPVVVPEPGVWNIMVIADEINQDGHVETSQLDADFALVVTGISELVGACCLPSGNCIDTTEPDCAQQEGLFHLDRTCATIRNCPVQQ